MVKTYEGHEIFYKRMKKKGIRSWNEYHRIKAVEAGTKRFLNDALAQPWAPKSGRAIELGCGTGPILRWICKKDFSGLGVDVCKTAIAMAREQSKGLTVKFKRADLCRVNVERLGKFDLAIDGHCLHCITGSDDRKKFLKNSFKLLRKGGLFIVMTMCGPGNRKLLSVRREGQKFIKHTIYTRWDKASKFEDYVTINGLNYLPTRKILHWKSILSEIQWAGFKIKLLRYNEAYGQEEPSGCLSVAALA
jgi:SAM-dependent methyltransferase